MKKLVLLFISFILTLSLCACSTSVTDEEANSQSGLTVAVGIVPQATFVEAVAGDLVDIITLVPPGNSPANYQPTTSEMQALSDAAIYFSMQTPTEKANILPTVSDFSEGIKITYLQDIVGDSYPLLYMDEENSTVDPHIWLSPQRVIVMVQTIADELSVIDEENAQTYQENAKNYIAELEALDQEIKEIIESNESKTFLIYHGAYSYFADDYGLDMIALESDGKQATATQLQEVIDLAKEEGITTVFYQVEFDDSQAVTLAEEIGGNVALAAPLTPDYIHGLRDFADAFVEQGE